MQYTTEPIKVREPSIFRRLLGAILMLIGLAILAHLINMTFFYVPAPNETPLEGWDLILGWGLGLTLSMGITFWGWGVWVMAGSGGAFASADPANRIRGIRNGNVPKDVLIRMAMTDPDAKVRDAAIKASAEEDLEAAYEHCKDAREYKCPELKAYGEKLHKNTLLKTAGTLEGFQSLDDKQRTQAIDLLPPATLRNYFPRLNEASDQRMIMDRFCEDVSFLRKVAGSTHYDNDIRIAALEHLNNPLEYCILFTSSETELRELAIEQLSSGEEHAAELFKQLPIENDHNLCQQIVTALGIKGSLLALKRNPTEAATKAIIEACDNVTYLKKVSMLPNLEATTTRRLKQRIEQIEKPKAQPARGQEKDRLFATIENLRESRPNRVAATVSLSKLRPKNKIEIQSQSQPAWHCPLCSNPGDVCMKPNNWKAMEEQMNRGGMIHGSVCCPQCNTSHPMQSILSGKYDIVMVDIYCPHCDMGMTGPIDSWINCECMQCGEIVIEK